LLIAPFVIPSEVGESLTVEPAMSRPRATKKSKAANLKRARSATRRRVKEIRGFPGIDTSVPREQDREDWSDWDATLADGLDKL
jgi:hypothetical protein